RFASDDASRAHLNGVYLDTETAAATDGHRLFCAQWSGIEGVIVDSDFLVTVNRCAGSLVSLELEDRRIIARGDDVAISGLLVDGKYPSYKQVMPNTSEMVSISFDK